LLQENGAAFLLLSYSSLADYDLPQIILKLSAYIVIMKKVQKTIIRQMAKGYTLREVAGYMKQRNMHPNSLSTVEKEVNKMKKIFVPKITVLLFVLLVRQGLLKM
tara:strand:+ start:112 stop:426 length:315 start_codon:yes stop_codon:yes gene_type:complete